MRLRYVLIAMFTALALFAVPAAAHDPEEPNLVGIDQVADHVPGGPASGDIRSRNMQHKVNIPSLGFTNSDLAFQGRLVYAGNYGGFRVIDFSRPKAPVTIANVECPGAQNDISVWGDVLILSVDEVRTAPTCDSERAEPQTSEDGWEGLRIFDVSDPANPQFVTGVYTACGSHTHTGIPDEANDRVLVYVASYPLRSGPDCGPHDDASDTHNPLHEIISVVEVPLSDPASASVVATPALDVPTWSLLSDALPDLFNPMRGCHDIQVDVGRHLAAAACSSVGQLWDISDPYSPSVIWATDQPEVQFYHSALFGERGDTVIFGDEIIFGSCDDGTGSGQLWFHNVHNGNLFSSFGLPRAQPDQYCSAHLFNNIPGVQGEKLVGAWYQGGVNVVDYTNRTNPREIGYVDLPDSFVWSAYWYDNFVYANDIVRGVDTYTLDLRYRRGADRLSELNPQTQVTLYP